MMDEILLEDVILCSGCHHNDHANGNCRAPNDPVMAAAFGSPTCLCGQRLTGDQSVRVNSVPAGGRIGDYPTIRGDRR